MKSSTITRHHSCPEKVYYLGVENTIYAVDAKQVLSTHVTKELKQESVADLSYTSTFSFQGNPLFQLSELFGATQSNDTSLNSISSKTAPKQFVILQGEHKPFGIFVDRISPALPTVSSQITQLPELFVNSLHGINPYRSILMLSKEPERRSTFQQSIQRSRSVRPVLLLDSICLSQRIGFQSQQSVLDHSESSHGVQESLIVDSPSTFSANSEPSKQTRSQPASVLVFSPLTNHQPSHQATRFVVSYSQVLEIRDAVAPLKVPGACNSLHGLVTWNERPIPVIDLNYYLYRQKDKHLTAPKLLIARFSSRIEFVGFFIQKHVQTVRLQSDIQPEQNFMLDTPKSCLGPYQLKDKHVWAVKLDDLLIHSQSSTHLVNSYGSGE